MTENESESEGGEAFEEYLSRLVEATGIESVERYGDDAIGVVYEEPGEVGVGHKMSTRFLENGYAVRMVASQAGTVTFERITDPTGFNSADDGQEDV